MKKRVIALSVAAALGGGFSGAFAQTLDDGLAEELVFNPTGVGHILIVPYFSTQSGNATLLNIVNTDQVNGKAVKVRFRGASNSDDIFDFQVFLSPGDVWTANVSQAGSGLSQLSTSDRSCTLPASVNQEFIPARLNPALSASDLANETREGYIEILNMADIPSAGTGSIWSVTKHNAAGTASCTASILESIAINDTRLASPTTGLMANWTIINVPNTTVWTADAAAIEARTLRLSPVSDGVATTGNNVYWPQTSDPVEPTSGFLIDDLSADPLFRSGALEASYFDLPDLSTPYTTGAFSATPQQQANFLSQSFSATQVAGEFLSSASINASTDWVVSKPTRRYYAAVDYTADPLEIISNYDDNTDSDAIYYRESDGVNIVFGSAANGGKSYQICTQVSSVKFYNREEFSPASSNVVISPGTPRPAPSLCGEVSVLGINSATSPLGASVARQNISVSGITDGWGVLTANNTYSSANLGLPMFVRQFSKATNPAVQPGVSGTFGGAWIARTLERGAQFFSFIP